MSFLNRLQDYLSKPLDATGLALFRIAYGLTLLGEVLQLYYFRHLVFDPIPYVHTFELDFGPALLVWLAVILCIVFGFYTRVATILHYAFLLVFFATMKTFEYHMFYTDMALGFVMMFMGMDKRLSLDNVRRRIASPGDTVPTEHFQVPRWHYTAPVLLALGFVYFDSIFHKMYSTAWQSGLGMWLPASVANFNQAPFLQPLLNFKYLMLFVGYLTFAFEALFIVLMWFKRVRLWLAALGIALHLGIAAIFPIPWFALGYLSIYLLLVPHGIWRKIARSWRKRSGTVEAHYDPGDDAQVRARAWVDALDFLRVVHWQERAGGAAEEVFETYRKLPVHKRASLNSPGFTRWAIRERRKAPADYRRPARLSKRSIIVCSLVFGVMQLNSTCHSPPGIQVWRKAGLMESRTFLTLSSELQRVSKRYLGITPHTMFLDFHFFGYNHIIAVFHVRDDGTEEVLPLFNADGTPAWYVYGANWVKMNFRVNSPNVNQRMLESGLQRFTAFWAHKNDVSLRDATFKLRVKRVEIPSEWKEDFLTEQREKGWVDAGELRWLGGRFQTNMAIIESL